MKPPKTYSEALTYALRARRVEPQQRLVGGRYGWAIHTYEIRGGIRVVDVMAQNIVNTNPLYDALKKQADHA